MLRNLRFAALFAVLAPAAQAAELTWASRTDPQTMDPYAVKSAPFLGFLNNVYEGLVRPAQHMTIESALATNWEPVGDGEGWRFNLRRDVTLHNGAALTAQDVLVSYVRGFSDAADTRRWFAPVSGVIIVDDFAIDFMTTAPNPIFPDSIPNWMIIDSGWATANEATRPDQEHGNHATLNANSTGAFAITTREPGLRTVLEPHAGWWDIATHTITKAALTPIQHRATALAALLSGDVDFINPVPVQDVARLQQDANIKVFQGIEARVIMLGFPHEAETLKYSAEAADANPFTDPRVRRAVAHAINVPAILQTTMRGTAEAVNQLVSPAMRGYSDALGGDAAFDPAATRALLTEAGYPDGFSFGFKCPNDRYLNDEAVCQAMTPILAQVGMHATLDAMPVQTYWPKLRADNYDVYLLGWSPGTFDAEHPSRFLAATPNEANRLGSWNFGGYSDARGDELLPMIQSEIDEPTRQAMQDEVAQILQRDTAYVPLYVQPSVWGAREHRSGTTARQLLYLAMGSR